MQNKVILKKNILKIILFIALVMAFMPLQVQANTNHDNHTTWTELTDGGELSGSYYLSQNVLLSTKIIVPENNTLNICLNGYILSFSDTVIEVNPGAILNLYDCQNGKNYTIETPTSDTITITTGYITGSYGSGIINNGTFNMYGGTIANNSALWGGGVNNNGTFNMYDGTITANSTNPSGGYGGGIYNGDIFNMYGGTVSYNKGHSLGGGIVNWVNSTVNIYGGNITNNVSNTGGGIYANGDVEFNLSGGTIINNVANRECGGIGCYKINISGNPTITNNTLKDNATEDNLHVSSKTININGTITGGKIGLSTKEGTSILGWNTYMDESSIEYSDIFETDDSDYLLTFKDGEVIAVKKITITFNTNDGSNNPTEITQIVLDNTETNLNKNTFIISDMEFCGWNTKADGTGVSYKDRQSATFTEDTTLYAQWKEIYTYTFLTGGNQTLILNKTDEYSFKIDGNYLLFNKLIISDLELVKDVDYTVTNGSTIITFTETGLAKLNTLAVGTYDVVVEYSNDKEVTGKLIIEADATEEDNTENTNKPTGNNPQTGDDIMLFVAVLGISIIGIINTTIFSKKIKNN